MKDAYYRTRYQELIDEINLHCSLIVGEEKLLFNYRLAVQLKLLNHGPLKITLKVFYKII